jgi:hypothetical protein
MSTLETNLIQPSTGTTLTVGASGDTIDIPSGATLDATGATITGALANSPSFSAYRSGGNQTLANNTDVVLQFNTELYDVGSCYDTSTYRFTPNVAGKYFINSIIKLNGGGNSVLYDLYIYKNTTVVRTTRDETTPADPFSMQVSAIVEANGSSDYFTIQFYQASSSVQLSSSTNSAFEAFKLIGV